LRPLLEGARDWIPPADAARIFGRTHFADRAADRGVRSVPGHLLLWVVLEALRLERSDLVEPVFLLCEGDGSFLYRVLLPEGVFYPVVRNGAAVTLYSAAEVRVLRQRRRHRHRMVGRRQRRAPGSVHEW